MNEVLRRGGGAAMLTCGLLATTLVFCDTSRNETVSPNGTGAPSEGRTGNPIGKRDVDPVEPPLFWLEAGEDSKMMRRLSSNAIEFAALFQQMNTERYSQFRRLQGFVDSAANSSPFGVKMASCRVRHEPLFEEDCRPGISVVMKKSDDGDGVAVFVEALMSSDASRACRLWAGCVVAAWPGRIFSRMSEITEGKFLALRAPITRGGFHGLPEDEFGVFYHKICGQYELLLESSRTTELSVKISAEDRQRYDLSKQMQADLASMRLEDCRAVLDAYESN